MQYTALGMIETLGLVACIEAADAATKAAEVHVLGMEFVTGGLVMIRFIGDTASVQAAVDAGSGAASRVGMLVSTRVISRLDDQVIQMLGLTDPHPTPAVNERAGRDTGIAGELGQAKAPAARDDAVKRRAGSEAARGASGIVPSDSGAGASGAGALEALSTSELRAMARSIPDFPAKGRDLNRLSKEELIARLTEIQTQGKGHE